MIVKGAEQASVQLCSVRSLDLTDILKTMQNLGLTVTDELRIPLTLPGGRRCLLYRFGIEAPAERIASLREGEERFVDALRALDEERATDDPLNGLILSAGLSWRDVELLRTLRNHLLQIRTHWNAETVNGVLVRNSAAAGALYRAFAARFDPALPGERAAAVAEADAGFTRALDGGPQPRRGRGAARLREPGARGAAHERLPAPGAAGVLDQGRLQEGRGDAVAAADVRDLRPLAAARGHPPARRQGGARRHPLVATATTTSAPRSWG